jgi:IclR family acetate operon transcriptional repressor
MVYLEVNVSHYGPFGVVSSDGRRVVTANDRAFDLLDAVAESRTPQRLIDLVTSSELAKPTVRRLLLTMQGQGLIRQDAERRYVPGLRILDVAASAIERVDLAAEGRDALDKLRSHVAGTLSMFEYGDRILRMTTTMATNSAYKVAVHDIASTSFHATAAGKAVLAFLPEPDAGWLLGPGALQRYTPTTVTELVDLRAQLAEVAKRGYAVDDEESRPGVRGVAAAVRTFLGRPVAAIALSVAASHCSSQSLHDVGPRVVAAADEISGILGAVPLREPVQGPVASPPRPSR